MSISRRTAHAIGASVVLCALVLALVDVAPALAGPTVTVRVEGESSTLLPLTSVTLEQPEPVSGCPADSATAAINLAVGGNWDHGDERGSKGDFTETILGVTESFSNESATWAVWINDKWAGGICEDLLGAGDEVLLIADHEPPPSYAPTVLPLIVTGVPPNVVAGVPFSVSVEKIHTRPGTFAEIGEGTPEPEGGVSITGGGASTESNSAGVATLTLAQPGKYALIARKPADAPSAPVAVCVKATAGESGCGAPGSSSSSTSSGSTSGPASGASSVFSTSYKGPYAIVAKATNLIEGHVYSRKHAPRVLAGTVQAHTTVASVSLKLRRDYKGRCYAYDGTREEFGRARCGAGSYFKVSTKPSFSYLLPSALAPGRYVLDIEATDAAGNRTSLARGTSRTVFYVR
jgi:hypothetical protein